MVFDWCAFPDSHLVEDTPSTGPHYYTYMYYTHTLHRSTLLHTLHRSTLHTFSQVHTTHKLHRSTLTVHTRSTGPHYHTTHASQVHSFRNLTYDEAMYKLQHYFKFAIVRNPLERLLSAYKNKLERPFNIGKSCDCHVVLLMQFIIMLNGFAQIHCTSIGLYRVYVYYNSHSLTHTHTHTHTHCIYLRPLHTHAQTELRKFFPERLKAFILKLYRREEFEKWIARNNSLEDIHPSFDEFVQFMNSYPLTAYNEHFKPFLELCNPCAVNFDLFLSFKTLEYDVYALLDYLSE